MVKLLPFVEPVTAGLELTTRMRYKLPVGVLQGMVQLIIPELAALFKVPIGVGVAKLPVASDNWAVYMFPNPKVPVEVTTT